MPNYLLPGVTQIPSQLIIASISKTLPMIITIVLSAYAMTANTYLPGMAVRLSVPRTYGMYQADGLTGVILAISGSTIVLNIDSTYFDAFVIPTPMPMTEAPASLAPAGSRNLQYNNFTGQVPFQSLNNIGN